ncbi:CHAT domain-containing protein [Roseofilum reptotaenium CS-1145]|uniref:CHAT domain-containing protein n=1 Tax=Roseofilum reptotaenium AO1-A TaxID=1925591 RepID=A0A1L9QUX1_9CYAN|nr:CHAT domain-containing tetratricopeptide repeat protein [Roseofilum reptotaenium]MDB9516305.1 CHAT domain-containing protein [Roseofilum reptotaenium CS-1145]OJJ26481.1 hypothetical protein BI308_06440 [Roseofilum reptotaenium AO1-A]
MKLYQFTTTVIITLVSILGNPLESFSQKKPFIPSALAQDSWVNSPNRIEITEKISDREIGRVLMYIINKRQFNAPISEADKQAIIEDLEQIEALKKNIFAIDSNICTGYNIAEAWEKAIKACKRDLRKGGVPHIFHPIHEAYVGAKKYKKAINSLKKSLHVESDNRGHSYVSYRQLGAIYFQLGNYAEATRQYQKAIDSIEKYQDQFSCQTCVDDPFSSRISYIQSSLGFSLLQQGKIDAAEKKFLEAMKNDRKSWNKTIVNLLERFAGSGGSWDNHLFGEAGLFSYGLTELRIQQKKYTEALEFAEYGRTRILSYLIDKNKESSISIDEIKAIAKEQNATLVKYLTPVSINAFGINPTYEPKLYIWIVKPTGEVHFVREDFSLIDSKYNRILSNNHSINSDKRSNSFSHLAIFIILLIPLSGTYLFFKFPHQRKLILISSLGTAIVTTGTIIINQTTTTSSNQNSEISLANLSINTFASVRGSATKDLPESEIGSNCQSKEEKQQMIIIDDCLKEAHKILIEPIAQLLPKNPEEEVIIIPDGELFRVPFAALTGKDNKYLIQKHTLRISPSIKLLQITQQQKAKKAPNLSNQNLVVGNPVMPIGNNGEQLKALPDAEKEAEAIAQLLDTTAITGTRATKSRITRLMPNANIIHLATHGNPFSLAFAPSGQDLGFLGEHEIYNFDLTADLVVLSACETGLGEITTDGVVGIARPFVGAGVPSVVISLWQVPDEATSKLMVDFYKNLQAGENKAQALRQAMLTTMEEYSEPGYWAGFFLVGES